MSPAGTLLPEDRTDRIILGVAFLLALLTGYFLFFYQGNLGGGEGAIPIGILQTDKTVRMRHARSLRWGVAYKESTVYLKDTVYTPKDTTAEFQWKDKRFILEPDSLVQFDESSLDKLEITLFEGKIRTDSESAKLLRISKPSIPPILFFKRQEIAYLADINPLILRHGELSSRALEVLEKKVEIEPMRAVLIPKLFLNQLSDYQLVIQYPKNRIYQFEGRGWLDFQWMALPLPQVTYLINVSNNSSFNEGAKTQILTSHARVLFEETGDYWWKIVAKWKRESLDSEVRELSLDSEKGEKALLRFISSETEPRLEKTLAEKSQTKQPLKGVVGNEKIDKPEQNKNKKQRTPFEIFFDK